MPHPFLYSRACVVRTVGLSGGSLPPFLLPFPACLPVSGLSESACLCERVRPARVPPNSARARSSAARLAVTGHCQVLSLT